MAVAFTSMPEARRACRAAWADLTVSARYGIRMSHELSAPYPRDTTIQAILGRIQTAKEIREQLAHAQSLLVKKAAMLSPFMSGPEFALGKRQISRLCRYPSRLARELGAQIDVAEHRLFVVADQYHANRALPPEKRISLNARIGKGTLFEEQFDVRVYSLTAKGFELFLQSNRGERWGSLFVGAQREGREEKRSIFRGRVLLHNIRLLGPACPLRNTARIKILVHTLFMAMCSDGSPLGDRKVTYIWMERSAESDGLQHCGFRVETGPSGRLLVIGGEATPIAETRLADGTLWGDRLGIEPRLQRVVLVVLGRGL